MKIKCINNLSFLFKKGIWHGLMKTLLLLFCTTVFSFTPNAILSQNTKIKIDSDKLISVDEVFDLIKKQTDYVFVYQDELFKNMPKVSLKKGSIKVSYLLEKILTPNQFQLKITNNNQIVVNKVIQKMTSAVQQEISITGVITDEKGLPLPGVNVIVKGEMKAAISDLDGKYRISVSPSSILVFSMVGYKDTQIKVTDQKQINITMLESISELDQVVVTALGIKKESKALSYNVQKINAEEVTRVNDGSFINSLAGKVAGVTINGSSAGVGSSSRVVMRGVKSISGNNNALYVIDGIPMQNSTSGQANDIFSGAGQTGDAMSNINPDDIESISILSGPAAAALYGSAAANGAIMITTKKGKEGKLEIQMNSNTSFSNPLILPEFQNTYGLSEVGSYKSWGEKLVTPSNYKPSSFFQTGVNTTNSLSLSVGTEKNQTYVSLGSVNSKGIVSNNDYNRYNLSVRNTTSVLKDKMSIDIGYIASIIDEQNMISQGQYFNPLLAVYLFPAGDDFTKVKSFERYDPSRNLRTQYWPSGDNGLSMQNPYWITQRDLFQNTKNKYLTTLGLKYKIADGIDVSVRGRLDRGFDKYEKKFAASTNTLFASENGYYSLNSIDTRDIYTEGLVNIDKDLAKDFNMTANIGASLNDFTYNQDLYGGKLQGVANLYTYSNIIKATADVAQSGYHTQKQSVFGNFQWAYKKAVYLSATARNDWPSTLSGASNKSFFYPSVGISGILTEILNIKSDLLSYLKVRGSYSEVGNEPKPFLTNPTYSLSGGYPVTQTRLPNPNLQPELTKSWEAGINSTFFKGKLKLDATAYTSSTYNQFFEPTLSSASGYTSVIVNAGRIDNKGLELNVNYSNKLGGVNWSSYVTYSLNKNKIVELLPSWTNPVTGEIISLSEISEAGTGSYKMILKEGGSVGDIYVNTLRTDEHGAIYVDPGSKTVVAEPNKFVYAGNSNPKYNIGFGNDFKYKGISLNVLFTARVGGVVVSNTQAIMDNFGISKASADARDAGGVAVNGKLIPAKEYYEVVGSGASGGVASMYTYSATNVRLSQLSLGYDLPIKKWENYVKKINVSLIGQNLFLLYNSAPFDPELTANTGTYYQGIDYFMMPSLRRLGISVKVNF